MKYGRLILAIFLWYTASAFANTSSRKFLTTVARSPLLLTFSQFITTTFLLTLHQGIHSKYSVYNIISSAVLREKRHPSDLLLLKLSVVYTIGFVFVNAGYVYVNVSLAETLRAAEPLVSIFLVRYFLPSERTSYLMFASMIIIFIGGLLSSMSDTSFSFLGLTFVTISNISFSTRSLLTKQVKEVIEIDSFHLFLIISKVGSVFLGFFLILEVMVGSFHFTSRDIDVEIDQIFQLLALNNFSYFLYNQMSFYILTQITMVSHAVTNALRRIVTIVFSVWYFRNEITVTNGLGIFLAVFGLLIYSYSKQQIQTFKPLPQEEVV